MAKERKCKKCGLTYKGFAAECPYCHKSTKFGLLNKIMMVIGYMTTVAVLGLIVYYEILKLMVLSFAFVPLMIFIGFILVVAAIIVLIFK